MLIFVKNLSRILFLILVSGVLSTACKRKISRQETETNLKRSMAQFLDQQPGKSPQEHFKVLDVVYFEDAHSYICHFKVEMINPIKDTTGEMMAKISKDFIDVQRGY